MTTRIGDFSEKKNFTMKKILIILLVSLLALPSYAQKGKGLKRLFQFFDRSAVTRTVTRQAAASSLGSSARAGIQLVKITNLPGMPLVQVRVPEESVPSQQVQPAQVLPPSQVHKSISLVKDMSAQLYVPSALAEPGMALYRGLRIKNLKDVENILLRGMEISKSRFSKLYFSYYPDVALGYTLPPEEWATYEDIGEIDFELPVLVKVPVTIRLLEKNTPHDDGTETILYQDLWADMISHVFVFLKIGEKTDWYEVVLEGGKLLLKPTPTTNMPGWIDMDR